MFAAAYPNTRQVEPINLLQAVFRAFANPRPDPVQGTKLVELDTFVQQNANRVTVVFPECTTSNGRGLLRFADLFTGIEVPVSTFRVYIMCVRLAIDMVEPSATVNNSACQIRSSDSLDPNNVLLYRIINIQPSRTCF